MVENTYIIAEYMSLKGIFSSKMHYFVQVAEKANLEIKKRQVVAFVSSRNEIFTPAFEPNINISLKKRYHSCAKINSNIKYGAISYLTYNYCLYNNITSDLKHLKC